MPIHSVAHLTSAHPRYDTRIFLKECRSLAAAGYKTTLIVADGEGDDTRDDVTIKDVGANRGRLDRMWSVTRRVYRQAMIADADIYHLHDPELLPIALKLKRAGKIVIFDSHEDVPLQLLGKPYLNRIVKIVLSKVFRLFESYACKRLDAIVTATPFICEKFLLINEKSVTINNYPMEGELISNQNGDWSHKEPHVCYVGGVAAIRGIQELVEAFALVKTDARLQLGGSFSETTVEESVRKSVGWSSRVDELGWLDRRQVADVLQRSMAGVVTFLPAPNHINAQPNKMFEYMSAGVPVIASDFPLWREIIEGNACGLCVDPCDPQAIAEAIDFLVVNPDQARQMGMNGQRAVKERYNWAIEEHKLLSLYSSLSQLSKGSS